MNCRSVKPDSIRAPYLLLKQTCLQPPTPTPNFQSRECSPASHQSIAPTWRDMANTIGEGGRVRFLSAFVPCESMGEINLFDPATAIAPAISKGS